MSFCICDKKKFVLIQILSDYYVNITNTLWLQVVFQNGQVLAGQKLLLILSEYGWWTAHTKYIILLNPMDRYTLDVECVAQFYKVCMFMPHSHYRQYTRR